MLDTKGLLTVKQYADYRKVSRHTVYKYLRNGKLSDSVYKIDNQTMIDPVLADRELSENLDRIMNPRFIKHLDALPSDAMQKIQEAGCESLTLEEAQRLQAHFKAELLKLEYGVKTGKLYRTDIVERKTFAHARQIRDNILMVPDLISPEIAATTNEAQVREILTNAMTEAMADLDVMPDYSVED